MPKPIDERLNEILCYYGESRECNKAVAMEIKQAFREDLPEKKDLPHPKYPESYQWVKGYNQFRKELLERWK